MKKNLEEVIYEIDQQGKLQANTILFSTCRKFFTNDRSTISSTKQEDNNYTIPEHIINKVLSYFCYTAPLTMHIYNIVFFMFPFNKNYNTVH